MPASAINPFQMSANSKSGTSQQANNGSGVDFGATLADARQSAGSSSNSQSAQKSNQDQNQQAQNQAQQSSNQDSDNSTDSATAASKAAARVAAAQDKQDAQPDSNTTAWLAMLQGMLGQQAQVQTLPTDTSSKGDQNAASALSSLNDWLAAHQGDTADATQSTADTQSILQGLQASTGKNGKDTADIAADDGNFLPLLQNAIADNNSDDDKHTDTAALAQLASTQQHTTQSTSQTDASKQTVPSHQIDIPVTDNKWSEAVAQRVSMMVGKQEQQLDMQLNPPHLGPMEVRLSMSQDQASVIFTSQHANVREALAAATPRLSALLADQGITLSNVQVASDSLNQQAQQQQQAQRQFDGNQGRNTNWSGDADNSTASVAQVSTTLRIPVARSGLNLWA
ncbi:flagellar hook-length control protein FliK [Silvimonas iriomotensis]|uniref:Flagellar hook-length control protein-like C-terminal domain-containing protein n=1 Tax=Silvimonas iriomotensis TaxID=449662 RepID=A0ABQ2P7U4_9NEIS|nr:flagellar hook-length control protein FliK [Silvimonas iriomotensis]GGP20531.1 hypothetical protein GCM10010970_15670 [Silvimonas iriomotensis]